MVNRIISSSLLYTPKIKNDLQLKTFKVRSEPGGGRILATSPCIFARVYTWDSLLIQDIKRLWHIHTVQTSNIQYAFGVQVYGEVLYIRFYSVFSEQFINDEILLCKRLIVCLPLKMESCIR